MENYTKLISIIIPVYNSVNALPITMNSLIKQCNDNYEIILVDDGSVDGSGELCDYYSQKYNNCVISLHQKNTGSLGARILGAKHSTGLYIMYVDSDDKIEDGALGRLSGYINQKKADVLLFDQYIMLGKEKKILKLFGEKCCIVEGEISRQDIFHAFMQGKLNSMCTCVVKSEIIKKTFHLNSSEKICLGEDKLQKLYVLLNSKKIIYIPYAYYIYLISSESQGASGRVGILNKQVFKDYIIVAEHIRKNYKQMGFSKTELKQYDAKMIEQISSLIDQNIYKNKLNSHEKTMLLQTISDNSIYREILDSCWEEINFHSKMINQFLAYKQYSMLDLYVRCCNLARRIKYGKS